MEEEEEDVRPGGTQDITAEEEMVMPPSSTGHAAAAMPPPPPADAGLAAAAASDDSEEDGRAHVMVPATAAKAKAVAAPAKTPVVAPFVVLPHATQAVDAVVDDDEGDDEEEPDEAAAGGAAATAGPVVEGAPRMTRAKGVLPSNFSYVSLDPYWQRAYEKLGCPLPPAGTAQPRPPVASKPAHAKKRGAAHERRGSSKKQKMQTASGNATAAATTVSTRRAAGGAAQATGVDDANFFLAMDPHWKRVYEKLGGLPDAPPPKPKPRRPVVKKVVKKAPAASKKAAEDFDFFLLSDPYWRRVYEKLGKVDAHGSRIVRPGDKPSPEDMEDGEEARTAPPKRATAAKSQRKEAARGTPIPAAVKQRGSKAASAKKQSRRSGAPHAVGMSDDVHDEHMYEEEEQQEQDEEQEEAEMPAAALEGDVDAEEEEDMDFDNLPITQAAPSAATAAAAARRVTGFVGRRSVAFGPDGGGLTGGYVYGVDSTADVQFFTAGGAAGLMFL